MYPLYFYICLLASLLMLVGLILLAILPWKLPVTNQTPPKASNYHRKARSPTRVKKQQTYWDFTLTDDEDDL